MDTPLYDIYLSGQLAPGLTREQAAARLAQLFKSNPETLAGLLTGQPRLLKRGVDHATAVKYRQTLARAGVGATFKAQAAAAARPAAAPAASALSLAPAGAEVLTATERQRAPLAEIDTSHLSLAPPGADREDAPQLPAIDTTPVDWTLAPPGSPLETLATAAAALDPDTSGLSLAPAGTELLSEAQRRREQPPAPATDHLTLLENAG